MKYTIPAGERFFRENKAGILEATTADTAVDGEIVDITLGDDGKAVFRSDAGDYMFLEKVIIASILNGGE